MKEAMNVISTAKAPAAVGPYVQAVRTGNLVFCSGQLGIDPATGKLPETVEAQAENSLNNLGAILEEAGSGFDKVVKTTVFLADMNDFAKVNEIYRAHFGSSFPARSCVQVGKLPLGGLVEIECIGVCG